MQDTIMSLARRGKARGFSTNTPVIHWLIDLVILFESWTLRCHQAQTVREKTSFSYRINYTTQVEEIQFFIGILNCIIGSKVTAILLISWILSIGGEASGRVSAQPMKQAGFHSKVLQLFFNRLKTLWTLYTVFKSEGNLNTNDISPKYQLKGD